jgi:peptidyl-prolyl cis-trans isomerase D
LKDVAKEVELPVQVTPLFTRKGLSKGVASHREVIQAAFSDEVLQDGDNSQVIAIDDSYLIVLRRHKHLMPSVEPLSKVENVLEQQLIQEKASAKAAEAGKEWIISLKKDPSTKLSTPWLVQKAVARDDSALNSAILSTLFKMSLANNANNVNINEKGPVFAGVTLSNGDYAILKLTHVEPGSMDSLDREEQRMFEKEMEAAEGIVDYNLYVDGLMHQAKIVEEKK